MLDPLLLLVITFAAGVVLGTLLTLTIIAVMRGKIEQPRHDSETKDKYTGPTKVWLSKSGLHFHLKIDCASLKVEGLQRRGLTEFQLCQHCAKKRSEFPDENCED